MLKLPRKSRARSAPQERQVKLAYDDITSVDADIEMVITLLQAQHGYTREKASTELVRRLSFAA